MRGKADETRRGLTASLLRVDQRVADSVARFGGAQNFNQREAPRPNRLEFAGARVPAADLTKQDRILTKVDQPNSIALRIAMVAADEADLVATLRWGFEWDIAAAALVAREAGAAVSDAFGRKLDYNKRDPRAFGLIASAPGIHGATVDHLADRAATFSRA